MRFRVTDQLLKSTVLTDVFQYTLTLQAVGNVSKQEGVRLHTIMKGKVLEITDDGSIVGSTLQVLTERNTELETENEKLRAELADYRIQLAELQKGTG